MTEAQKQTYEEPLYNIGVAARLTGLPISTLHAWERRYRFPGSGRTAGGHRLYSEKDIARLRWVKSQVEDGMQTRQAIQAAQLLETQGHLPLTSKAEIPTATSAGPIPIEHAPLMDALLRHDLGQADRRMGELLAFYPPEDLTLRVISPALDDLGKAWAEGRITVADEHLASNYLRHRLLMWMVTGPPPRPVRPIILACAPGEWHEGSLLMLGVLLRRQGWPVAYLGQSVPLDDLAAFSRQIDPPAVVLIAMREESARSLADWPRHLAQKAGKPLVAFGGRAFVDQPELQGVVQGYYLGPTIQAGLAELLGYLQNNLTGSPRAT